MFCQNNSKKYSQWLTLYTICAATLFVDTAGKMYDFHLIEERGTSSEHAEMCKSLGYDGLAVINTPETFDYAKEITKHVILGFYIGAHYQPLQGAIIWDDGTPLTSDTRFIANALPGNLSIPFGRLTGSDDLRMGNGVKPKYGLCGYHKNAASESLGQKLVGRLDMSTRISLYGVKLFSVLECALLCGMNAQCRAAEFNSDLFTCALIGEYSSVGIIADPSVLTYVRKTYP